MTQSHSDDFQVIFLHSSSIIYTDQGELAKLELIFFRSSLLEPSDSKPLIIQLSKLKSCFLEGFVNKNIFILFVQVKLPDGLVKIGVERQGIFKIAHKVFNELFGVLHFILEHSLKACINASALSNRNRSSGDVLFQKLEVHLFAFCKSDVEELLPNWML